MGCSMANGFIFKELNKNLKIQGAVLNLLSNQHCQSSPIWVELGPIGRADYLKDPKQPPGFFLFYILILIFFF